MLNTYVFDDNSYQRLAANGIPWQTVLEVLRETSPTVQRHTGAVLQIAGRSHKGEWIGIVLIETELDNEYLVISARYLNTQESASLNHLTKGTS